MKVIPKSRWILNKEQSTDNNDVIVCQHCKNFFVVEKRKRYNFCPECGYRMLNEDEIKNDIKIEDLGISQRTYLALKRNNIDTLSDIRFSSKKRLKKSPYIGKTILAEILIICKQHDIELPEEDDGLR